MGKNTLWAVLILLLLAPWASFSEPSSPQHSVSTFSIVASDPDKGELGIAVASRFFAVGTVVPWAKAGVGAVATQSYANTTFGCRGLELLEQGFTPEETIGKLTGEDDNPARRQLGIVAADGPSGTYTGEECLAWAGGRQGPNYAVQGNILAGEAVVVAMEKAFLETGGTLADRLYAALIAGEDEFAAGVVQVKNLATGKKQDVPWTGDDCGPLAEAIRRILDES